MAEPTPDSKRLDSWKEIARHLRRDVTTAIRWERERGLPVHRVPGGKLSRVFAFAHELDDWLGRTSADLPPPQGPLDHSGSPSLSAPSRRPVLLVTGLVCVAILLGVVATLAWGRLRTTAVRLEIIGNALVGRAESGAIAWSHPFDMPIQATSSQWIYRGHLDADQRADYLAAIGIKSQAGNVVGDQLHRFSDAGRLLWWYQPRDQFSFRGGTFGSPWATSDIQAYRAGNVMRIAWTVHHFTWWPGLLLAVDPAGNRLATFVNSGWITRAAGTPDGRHLAIAGMTNAHKSYFVAVLDAERPDGASPEPEGTATECTSCPDGRPLHYYVFPRTDLSEQFTYPADPPALTVFPDGSVLVQVMETPGPAIGATLYEFGPAFELRKVRVSDSFDEWHRRLESEGRLRHSAEACPDRKSRVIQHWRPDSGWTNDRIAVGG